MHWDIEINTFEIEKKKKEIGIAVGVHFQCTVGNVTVVDIISCGWKFEKNSLLYAKFVFQEMIARKVVNLPAAARRWSRRRPEGLEARASSSSNRRAPTKAFRRGSSTTALTTRVICRALAPSSWIGVATLAATKALVVANRLSQLLLSTLQWYVDCESKRQSKSCQPVTRTKISLFLNYFLLPRRAKTL